MNVLTIPKGFNCGHLTYCLHDDDDYMYAEDIDLEFAHEEHWKVISAPHKANGELEGSMIVDKILSLPGYDLYIHEHDSVYLKRMVRYMELISNADNVYVHALNSDIARQIIYNDRSVKLQTFKLKYKPNIFDDFKSVDFLFLGRDSQAKPYHMLERYAKARGKTISKISEYEHEDLPVIFAKHKEFISSMKADGNESSLDYVMLEALTYGLYLYIDYSWKNTNAVKPFLNRIRFIHFYK